MKRIIALSLALLMLLSCFPVLGEEAETWLCACGILNKGNYCGECGSQKVTEEQTRITLRINGAERTGYYLGSLTSKGLPNDKKGLFVSDDDLPLLVYSGGWAKGVPADKGTLKDGNLTLHFKNIQGEYDRTGTYEGEVKDGLPSGQGIFVTTDEDISWEYVGEWKNGVMNGQGTTTYFNNDGTYKEFTGEHAKGMVKPIPLVFINKSLWWSPEGRRYRLGFSAANEDPKRTVREFEVIITLIRKGFENETFVRTSEQRFAPKGEMSVVITLYDLENVEALEEAVVYINKVYYTDGSVDKNYLPELSTYRWKIKEW